MTPWQPTRTTAVVPVKRFDSAKQRLSPALGAHARAALAEAMFFDTLTNLRRCRQLDHLIVVTAEPRAARTARWLGIAVLEQDRDHGHSEAAAAGVRAALATEADRVALLPADCPLVDPGELGAELGPLPRSALIVPDRHGTGTNALILSPPRVIEPSFGPDSCARHVALSRAAGIGYRVLEIDSLAIDLDTAEDLAAMRDQLVLNPKRAPRTAKMLWSLEADEAADEDTAEGPAHAAV